MPALCGFVPFASRIVSLWPARACFVLARRSVQGAVKEPDNSNLDNYRHQVCAGAWDFDVGVDRRPQRAVRDLILNRDQRMSLSMEKRQEHDQIGSVLGGCGKRRTSLDLIPAPRQSSYSL
jgi:hypothetical protein